MDKLNITEGEWTVHLGPLMPDGRHIAHLGDRLEIRAPNQVDNHRANAQAIVTAANNTYKQGIDPKAVPNMVQVLKYCINKLEKDDPESTELWDAKQALKKAEL